MLRIEYAYATHPGLYRKMNQDNLVCNGKTLPLAHDRTEKPAAGSFRLRDHALFGVFDGMGGEEHGEAASWIAAKTAAARVITDAAGLENYCLEANRAVCAYVKENRLSSSGTTASLLLFSPREVVSCHIGDSRVYRWEGDRLEQLTKDDVWPGRKHLLLRFLGIPEEEARIPPHLACYPLCPGSLFLICSDGLSGMLPDDRIATVLSGGGSLKRLAGTLLDLALEAGGRDNVTLLLIRPFLSSRLKRLTGKGSPPVRERP